MSPPDNAKRRPASAPPKLLYWSLLDHFIESKSGPELLTPDKMNPGFWTPDDVVVDTDLQRLVSDATPSSIDSRPIGFLERRPDLKKVRFALVDLTKNTDKKFDPTKP